MSNSFKSNSVNTQNSQNSSNSNSNHSMIISKSTLLNKPELKDSSVQTSPFSINFPQAIGCIEKLFERNEKICERSKSKKGQGDFFSLTFFFFLFLGVNLSLNY